MLNARSNAGAAPVLSLLLSGEDLVPIPFSVNFGAPSCGLEVGVDLCGSVSRVGPDIPASLRRQQHVLQHLTVMHCRIRDRIPPTQLVLLVDVHMVFVPILILAIFDGPARVRVFLPPLGGLTGPLDRTFPGFDRRVFVARVALLGHGDQ